MKTAFIQVKEKNKAWDEIEAKSIPYNKWGEIVKLAYQLSIIHAQEIRVSDLHPNNNGNYFHPSNALNYLKS